MLERETQKVNPIQKAIDVAKFPEGQSVINSRPLVNASFYEFIVGEGMIATNIGLRALGFDFLDNTTEMVSNTGLRVLAAQALILTGGIVYQVREFQNRELFGKYLSVNKTAVTSHYVGAQAFPFLKKERFIGELHFVGKNFALVVTKINAPIFEVVEDGLRGLSELAKACETDDKRVKGLNYFVGESKIAVGSLEKLGFEVGQRPPEKSKLIHRLDLSRFIKHASSTILESRTPRVAVISREALIENREKIDRAADAV